MCERCTERDEEISAPPATPVSQRQIPFETGEAAIYSPEYLARKERQRHGREPRPLPLYYRW